MGTAVDDFLAEMLPQQAAAETAIHNGDVAPRLALWSRNDPVTVFGAKRSATGGPYGLPHHTIRIEILDAKRRFASIWL